MAAVRNVVHYRVTEEITNLLNAFAIWASTQPDILAVALVGSYAREAATEASDIDLVVLVDDPHRYLENTGWVKRFGPVEKQRVEDYGTVTSLRVWYEGGPEVEYGLTTRDWIELPLDEGTKSVIRDGMRVLWEREALLSPHLQGQGRR
jgi:predicted nucleotidyltransferase